MKGKLNRIRQNNFAIIGRAGMDIYPDPPGTCTENAIRFFTCLGGSSANIAVAITKLGGKTSLITCVSDDAVGKFCINELKNYGVDSTYAKQVSGEMRTSLAVVESRVEHHQSVIYRNNAADFYMTEADVRAVDYSGFGALIVTGTALAAEPSRTACFVAFDLAKQAGLPIILDIDYRPYTWSSPQEAANIYTCAGQMSDIVVGNAEEFDVMEGKAGEGLALAEALAQRSASIVIYKMGENGSITFTDSATSFKTGIFKVRALKPTGAGDAFMGGLMSSLANGLPLETAVRRGSAAAAIVVAKVGCAPAMPTAHELDDFIAKSG